MRFEIQKREKSSVKLMVLSPLIAVALTIVTGAIIFTLIGVPPHQGLFIYFIKPWLSYWELQELAVKAAPLVMIGVGLSICYRANVWNIGAEGQFIMGALAGSIFPILLPEWEGALVFPAMMISGILGGALFALIPALLKVRFGASEILTSLLLVSIAQHLLDFLVRGPWRDPDGFNFPESRVFHDDAITPLLFDGGRLHVGIVVAVILALVVAFYVSRTLYGFQIQVVGQSPRAARFAGFSQSKLTIFVFLFSGGLAGLAGLFEVAGPIGQLRPEIPVGYGFTAIIVAFLGRLNPIGVIISGFVLALSYLGGESLETIFQVSKQIANVFQGLLLMFVLACDTLIFYRVKWVTNSSTAVHEEAVT